MIDEYSDWDAAYVLGSLDATERRDFEKHRASCDRCTAAVADLAGLPGLLSKVTPGDAAVVGGDDAFIPLPSTLLPRLVRSVRRRQRRVRGFIAGGIAAAAVIAAVLALALPSIIVPTHPSQLVALTQVVPNPLSASIRLTAERWGTRLEMNCHYGPPPASSRSLTDGAARYAMFVTDARGNTSQVATWSASPGSTVEPSGTTSLDLDEIRSIDVRSASTGAVLLSGRP